MTDKSAAAIREFAKTIYHTMNPVLRGDKKMEVDYIISDLTALIGEHYVAKEEVDKMVAEKCKKCKYRGLPDSINEALNSGDGVYRP